MIPDAEIVVDFTDDVQSQRFVDATIDVRSSVVIITMPDRGLTTIFPLDRIHEINVRQVVP